METPKIANQATDNELLIICLMRKLCSDGFKPESIRERFGKLFSLRSQAESDEL
jgi:hypothetical protein